MRQSQPSLAALARRDFLKRFFHDIATPLSAASLHLEGAVRRVRKGADPTDALVTARSELSRAFDLFDLGRDFLLSDTGEPESIDFDALVLEAAAAHPGVGVEGRTGAHVRAARASLAGALSALLVNAVEASTASTDATGAASTTPVRIQLDRGEGRVQARVENPGGLGTENTESLFSPKSARPGKKWGMGLARVRVAAADAGGSIRLDARDGFVIATLDLPEETV